jgi:hypothetical protein
MRTACSRIPSPIVPWARPLPARVAVLDFRVDLVGGRLLEAEGERAAGAAVGRILAAGGAPVEGAPAKHVPREDTGTAPLLAPPMGGSANVVARPIPRGAVWNMAVMITKVPGGGCGECEGPEQHPHQGSPEVFEDRYRPLGRGRG